MPTSVTITIVAHNSRRYLETCLRSVFRQTHRPLDVVVVDNASTDGTREILAGFGGRIRVIYNDRNVGFAAAQNQAIAASDGDWVLVLNPDARLLPSFVARLVASARIDDGLGAVCGRLLSSSRDLKPLPKPLIDSAGIYFTPAMRHFDRGWHEPDDGRFRKMEYVFGASAAAALYRRGMIEDISIGDEFFDPDFFVYREDADVAWRAQLMGWRCIYTPHARGYHVRNVLPGNRRAWPPAINMHSVKNRFLMRLKNMSGDLYWKNWFSITVRDLAVIGCCLLREHTSLKAFWFLAKNWKRVMAKRKLIQERRLATTEDIAAWFSYKPVSRPAPKKAVVEMRASAGA